MAHVRLLAAAALLLAALTGSTAALAAPAPLGEDSAACQSGEGPAILVNVEGLKDRAGEVKLELYPPNTADFLKDDRDLIAQGKLFRRVTAQTPKGGPVSLCIRVPRPGQYALLFTHNRDGKSKFSFWTDGAGFPSNQHLGRSRPVLGQALITAGKGVTTVTIQAQYLRGFSGFGPING